MQNLLLQSLQFRERLYDTESSGTLLRFDLRHRAQSPNTAKKILSKVMLTKPLNGAQKL